MACLPAEQPGTSPAAATLSAMRENFPNLQFVLMVGIGGGTPKVRLGDVVVGYPDKDFPHGGVIQYDYGKAKDGFKRMGFLNTPGPKVLTALQNARSTPPRQSDFRKNLNSFSDKFKRPGDGDAIVHYGLIASGNKVIKSAALRDQLCKDANDQIFCFEMESAGLLNQISCLVVRGISDLCDKRKNNDWHLYASAAAASWAKEFLRNISPAEDNTASHLTAVTTSRFKRLFPRDQALEVHKDYESEPMEQILTRLSSYSPDIELRRIARRRTSGTCQWVDETLEAWKCDPARSAVLAIIGKVGSGKTFAMSYAVEKLRGLHHFIQPTDRPFDIFCSLSKQMIGPEVPSSILLAIETGFGQRNRKTTLADVVDNILIPLLLQANDIVISIDGIDALDQTQQEEVLQYLELIMKCKPLKLLISRQETIFLDKGIAYTQAHLNNTQDIVNFVDSKLDKLSRPGQILEDEDRRNKVRQQLIQGADGMMLWVALVLDLLQDSTTPAEVDLRLKEIPSTLEKAYTCCLMRRDRMGKLLRNAQLLQWVAIVKESITVQLWQEILALDSNGEHYPDQEPSPLYIQRCGVGLVIVDDEDHTVSMVHHSAQRYLFSDTGSRALMDQDRDEDRDETVSAVPKLPTQRQRLATLAFAGLSIAHINFHTTGTMVRHVNTTVPVASMMPRIVSKIMGFDQRKATQLKLPTTSRPSQRTKFLTYAIKNWPTYVAQVEKHDPIFPAFRELALQLDKTENVHPWTDSTPRTINSLVQSMFAHAVSHNHLPLLQLAMEQDVLPRDAYSRILVGNALMLPLHLACRMGYLEVARLMARICEIDQRCPRTNHTSLYFAAEAGHNDIFQWLHSANAWSTIDCCNAFQVAVLNGHCQIARPLLFDMWSRARKGPLTHALSIIDQQLVTVVMSWMINEPGLQWLAHNIKEPLDIMLDWRAAVRFAIDSKRRAFLQILLQQPQNSMRELAKTIRHRSNDQLIALARRRGWRFEEVDLLARHPWIFPNEDYNGRLLCDAVMNHNPSLLRILTECRAIDLNSTEYPALLQACDKSTIEVLLDAEHLDLTRTDLSGMTALSYAVTHNMPSTLKRVLDRMSDDEVQLTDNKDRSPTSSTAALDRLRNVTALIQSFNAQDDIPSLIETLDETGRNALSRAAGRGHYSTVSALLSPEQIKAYDKRHRSPLFWAIYEGNVETVEILLEHICRGPAAYAARMRMEVMDHLIARNRADMFTAVDSALVFKGFTGRHGRAYLVSPSASAIASESPETPNLKIRNNRLPNLPNTFTHKPVPRQLVTGAHTVSDISCSQCGNNLGWKYVSAEEESQKYKVGKFILETKKVCRSSTWENDETIDDVAMRPDSARRRSSVLPPSQLTDLAEDVEFDSQDEDECEDLFAGVWTPQSAARRRKSRMTGKGDCD
ncbi:hypothetical protein AMS68_004080 [Peltaster fructicola]|uniref:Yippee domain-containing protein n=1 Tax=Peltaster fructicola TaxID=286661 RepID=A0A6H0XUZ9_9PEZI|nr:hypothetical protein AMS68_004080 [Peltaster fructicola]